jgi:putative DNA primase/helicase
MDRAVERGQSFLDDEAERMLTGSAWRATDDDPASLAWPDPQPMAAKVEPKPYPLDALPATILAAVEEVAGFVKAPVPMVVSSALGALSLACQAHVDVKRAEKLTGPVGLFLLTLGDSGERKSTCDGFFVAAIRDYQEEQAEAMKPEVERYEADIEAWSSERSGILEAIKSAGKTDKPTEGLRHRLAQLQHDKPEKPRIPRLLLGDETPENLAWGMAKRWPSAGVISSEAGQILGAHGMGKDSVMRNLGLLNTLWDGGEHSVGRRTSESFVVKGARLTVALQIQEPTLRSFFDKTGALARGTGFLARFLVAWPESTQGHRPFTEAPENWPHLATFHRRIAAILNKPAPIDEDGALTPQMLGLTPDAKAAWIEYHDAVENELRSGGELYDVRDVASKSADNAVRLAALFHVFEHGAGAISLEAFDGASRIAAWHLNESRRFFGELALPAELADASRLDTWLIGHCKRERTHMVGKNHVRQHGPLRDGARLDAAIKELGNLDRMRVTKEGKKIMLLVNPALVEVPL